MKEPYSGKILKTYSSLLNKIYLPNPLLSKTRPAQQYFANVIIL